MNFFDWMDATSANKKGLTSEERRQRLEYRERIAAAAGTTRGTLKVAKCRGRIGDGLLQRLITATADEQLKITSA